MLKANPMKLHYNATGPDRKELVAVISKTIGMKPVYKGMPTCAYAVNNILVEKDGTVVYDERTDQDTIEAIIIALATLQISIHDDVCLSPRLLLLSSISKDFFDILLQMHSSIFSLIYCSLYSHKL